MNKYKLLTPGPLSTTDSVKEEMLFDRCTWDDEYKQITQKIRRQLLAIAEASPAEYTAILLQGSGSYGVEAVLSTALGPQDVCLIVTNGAYGARMVAMAGRLGISHSVYSTPCHQTPDPQEVRAILLENPGITHLAMVHCETTTGILNPLAQIAAVAKEQGKTLIVDAMSSFGGIEIPMEQLGIDFLVSSANKCIQGVPGFCFVLANRYKLRGCEGHAHSLCLDLYDQWREMDRDGKWRFTSPTHAVAAFSRALDELAGEGGVPARNVRYRENNLLLREGLAELGFSAYVDTRLQSPLITTFLFPAVDFDFADFYRYVKERGFVLYPGKLTEVDSFRIGNIGDIHAKDIHALIRIIDDYMKGQK